MKGVFYKVAMAEPISSANVAPATSAGGRGKRKAKEDVYVESSDDKLFCELHFLFLVSQGVLIKCPSPRSTGLPTRHCGLGQFKFYLKYSFHIVFNIRFISIEGCYTPQLMVSIV